MFDKAYKEKVLKKVADTIDYASKNVHWFENDKEHSLERFEEAMDHLIRVHKEGRKIYTPEYKEISDDFTWASSPFKAITQKLFWTSSRDYGEMKNASFETTNGELVGKDLCDLADNQMSTPNQIAALRVRIKKAEQNSDPYFKPYIDACKEAYETLAPFAEAYKEIKNLVIKGNPPKKEEPKKPEKKETPKKVSENALERGTCACCFSNQARYNDGPIVSHGYQLDKVVGKTSDCSGSRFLPFEESDRGTRYMAESMFKNIEKYQKELSEADEWTVVHTSKYSPSAKKVVVVEVRPDDQWWNRYKSEAISKLKNKIRTSENNLNFYEEKLDEWQRLYGDKQITRDDGPGM